MTAKTVPDSRDIRQRTNTLKLCLVNSDAFNKSVSDHAFHEDDNQPAFHVRAWLQPITLRHSFEILVVGADVQQRTFFRLWLLFDLGWLCFRFLADLFSLYSSKNPP